MRLHHTDRIRAIAVPVSSPESEASHGAIDLAAHLARRCGAKVHLLAAESYPLWATSLGGEYVFAPMGPPGQLAAEEIERRGSALERRARDLGVPAEATVLAGDLESSLLDLIEAEGIDMVVVGSDGVGFWTRLLHSSVAGNLSRDASVPVLVVPAETDVSGLARGFRRVIVGAGGRAVADLGGRLSAALAISGAMIEFVHVLGSGVASQIDDLSALVADVAPSGCTSHPVIERGDVAEAIVRRASEHDADLIILGSRPHSTPGDRILGTIADKVLHDAPCCVLAIPEAVLAEHEERAHRERRIDEALEESFPASDPPSFTA